MSSSDNHRSERREKMLIAVAAIISAMTVRGLHYTTKGPLASFEYPIIAAKSYPIIILLAVVSGAFTTFIQGPLKTVIAAFLDRIPKLQRPMFVGGLVALAQWKGFSQSLPFIYRYFGKLARGKLEPLEIAQFITIKVLSIQSCILSGQVGGMIAPFLIVGSAIGALFGILADPLCLASFAAVGSASILSAFYQAPLAFTMLIVEMTQQIHLALPLLLVGFASVATSDWIKSQVSKKKT